MRTALEQARAGGRELLYENEALTIAAALGVAIPAHLVVPDPSAVAPGDLALLGGDRVVVKVMSPTITHKSEAGGVRVVDREPAAVSSAIAGMARAVPDAVGFLVAEYVEHEAGPAGEALLGMRKTREFGPVVTFGFGGMTAELMAGLAPGRATASLSPALARDLGPALDRCAATAPLTRGLRGAPPAVGRDALEALVGRALQFAGSALPEELVEFEINPLAFTKRGPIALDARARIGPAPDAGGRPALPPGAIGRVLRPKTIAVVGVSERRNLGRLILENVLDAGFPPAGVTVVKPGTPEIAGVRCVPDLEALGRVDLLVVAIGAAGVPELVEEVAAGGAAAGMILIPGGLGERPGTGERADRIVEALRGAPDPRPVVTGGNCMGIRSAAGCYDTTFIPAHKQSARVGDGRHPVAVISQSGAFVLSRLDRLAWLDPALVVTVGNQVDLTVGDYLDHVADDPDVDVAACYVEGFRPGDGIRWARAAARMRDRGGTVILHRGGRTGEGAGAAASHTAAVAGDARVAAALAEAAGALQADSPTEFEDLLRLAVLLGGRRPAGLRLGAVTNAGFEAVAMADALGPLSAASFSEGTAARLEEILDGQGLGGVVAVRNPMDLTPNCGDAGFADAVAAVLADPSVDAALVGCVPYTPSLETLAAGPGHDEDVTGGRSLASRLAALWDASSKPWAAVVDAGGLYDPMVAVLEGAGIPTFRSADRALRLLGRWVVSRAG